MIARYTSAITTSVLVTTALLLVMQLLISIPAKAITVSRDRGVLTFTRLIEEQPVEAEDYRREFENLTDPIDPTPPRPGADASVDRIGVKIGRAPAPAPTGKSAIGTVLHDGPLVSMVRVGPVYPLRALEQELEGWVLVQFDINRDGTVTNVSVVESSRRLFEKAAIDAARKFRFKSRVVDGIAQPSRGVQNLFRFEIDKS